MKCDTLLHKSRWYPGAGIYRPVRLVTRGEGHAKPGSVFKADPMWAAYVGVWHLGEQTGDNYADSSGHGLTATNTVDESIDGACAAKAGVIGDGRWQPKLAMRIPSYDSQQVGGVFTIGGWYYMDERKGYESFFNRKAAYNSGDGFLSNMQNNDKTLCIAANGSQQKTSGYALSAAVAARRPRTFRT